MIHGPLDLPTNYEVGDTSTTNADIGAMLDLGSLLLPNIPGLEVHLDLDPQTGNGKSVRLHTDTTIAEIQLFAAANNEDLWGEMRDAIAAGLRDQSVDAQTRIGRFGTEVFARMPTVDLDGNVEVQPVRFVGIRGSRWLMRVVISGDGAIGPTSGNAISEAVGIAAIDDLICALLVARGEEPKAPGERLLLHSPKRGPLAPNKSGPDDTKPANPFGHIHITL